MHIVCVKSKLQTTFRGPIFMYWTLSFVEEENALFGML